MALTKKIIQEASEEILEEGIDKVARRKEWRNIDFASRAKALNLYKNPEKQSANLKEAVINSIQKSKSDGESDTVKKAYSMLSELDNEGIRLANDLSSAEDVLNNGTAKDGIGLWGMIKKHPILAGSIAGGAIYGISEMTNDSPDY